MKQPLSRTDLILQIVWRVVECIRTKREQGRVRQIRRDVRRFARAAAEADTDTLAEMLADLPE